MLSVDCIRSYVTKGFRVGWDVESPVTAAAPASDDRDIDKAIGRSRTYL